MAVLLGFMVDLPAAWRALRHCRWQYIGWLAIWITLDRGMMAYKWRFLLTCRGVAISFWEALKAYYLASFAGCFLPSTVGADAMRVAAVSGPGRPSDLVAASVVMERALGFLAAAVAAGLGIILLAGLASELPHHLLWLCLAVLGGVVLAVLLSLSGWLAKHLERLQGHLAGRGKVLDWLGRFLTSYSDYRLQRSSLLLFLLLSLAEQSAPIVGTWLTALAFEIKLTLLESTAVVPLALLFTRIPVSLSGFGVVEGLYVAFFSLVGLTPTDSFLLGLAANLSIVVTTLPGAFVYTGGGLRIYRAEKAAAQADPAPSSQAPED